MNLCDTGPLVALSDSNDASHERCAEAFDRLSSEPLLTTWCCLTETMYLLGKSVGYPAQREIWQWIEDGALVIHQPGPDEQRRMSELMHQYRDTPMDLADASLVAAAERLGLREIFSLDKHFHVYRINGKHSFIVSP